jgi:hypothetical protein
VSSPIPIDEASVRQPRQPAMEAMDVTKEDGTMPQYERDFFRSNAHFVLRNDMFSSFSRRRTLDTSRHPRS